MGPGMRERDTVYHWWFWVVSLACAAAPVATAAPASEPSNPANDAKAVMAQELGEQPAPEGPCPERTVPHVLDNPHAAVHRTALGLAYCMLHEGPADGGVVPGPADVVKVHYSGWTEEGEMFDSSVERGEPVDLPLNAVIRGWGEGLRLMTPGDKARLWVPGNLGYGRRSPGAVAGTPPKGTLIFDVELLSIDRAAPTAHSASAEGAPKNAEDDSKPRLMPRRVQSEEKPNGLGHRRRVPSSEE
jgi:FKBP-type peptidyl-prolyl cis-trans isomerase